MGRVSRRKTTRADTVHLAAAAAAARLHGDGRLGCGAERKAEIYEDDDDDDGAGRRGRCASAKTLSQEADREIVAEPARRS